MKRMFLGIGLIVLICLSVYYFLSSEKIRNYPPKNTIVVAFGDSLVAGYGSTKGNDFVSVLGRKLGRDIVNLGVSGNTTKDGLVRIEEVTQLHPGVVIVLLGGNDTLKKVSQVETRANLSQIIELLQKEGAVVVLLGVRGGVLFDDTESMYQDLSKKYGTLYIPDVLDGIFLRPELMYDSIHPNDKGYARIAERVATLFVDNKL